MNDHISSIIGRATSAAHSESNKRRKVSGFKPGYIIKVVVQNFTTYSYAEFNLSPSLNMIIGPNGTGKSTLVSAICLGLGGKLDLIKRKSLKSMIKTGQTTAILEVTLQNRDGEPPLTIRRSFTEKESVWLLNNAKATELSIRKLVKSFNIQLDNLCHFLPQERVAEFAGLSPEKLLLEMERTLGDGHLLEKHEQLIEMDNKCCVLKERIVDVEARLEVILREREELELEAQRFEEYQEVVEKLNNHRKLIPYAQLSDMKKQQQDLKTRRDELKRKVLEFEAKLEPLDDEIKKANNEWIQQSEKSNEFDSVEATITRDLNDLQKTYANVIDEIDSARSSIDSLLDRSKTKKDEMDRIKEERNKLIQRRENLPQINENKLSLLNSDLNEKKDLATAHESEINGLNDSMETQRLRIRKAQEIMKTSQIKLNSKDKLYLLEGTSQYTNKSQEASYAVHKELRKTGEFKDQYFEAPVICCDTPDKSYAPYLEKAIDRNTLFAPTVTSSETFSRMTRFASGIANLPIRNVQIRPGEDFPAPPVPVETIRNMGFDGYVLDFIQGPDEVLAMLCNTSNLHRIPVCKRGLSENQIKKMMLFLEHDNIPISKFFSGNELFTTSRSKYGSKQFHYKTEKFPDRTFYFGRGGLSLEQKDILSREIKQQETLENISKQEIQNLQDELRKFTREHEVILRQIKDIKSEVVEMHDLKSSRASLDGSIKTREHKLISLERESKQDYTERIEKFKESIHEKYNLNTKTMAQITELVSDLAQAAIERNLLELSALQLQNKERSLKSLKEEYERQLDLIKGEYETARGRYDEIKNSDAAVALRAQNRLYTAEEKQILSELATEYINANNFTEEFVRSKINKLEDEKTMKSTADQSSLDSLQKKLADMETLEKELPILKSDNLKLEKRINDLKLTWEPELTDLVNQTSIQFNMKFTKVASDGRIELFKTERFQDWKLHILVKFRQESELKILDHQSQSGGERAVSTIFFIMSLQGLTDAPFRVVDEINQGMDPNNERLAHKYLVHTACQNNKSQYFLVTPKLLTGLYYHPDMVVHCIYTGPLTPPVEKTPNKIGFLDFVGKALST